MDKCRICLGNKKNCLSIFMSDNDTQYSEMVRSLTNIKIVKDDGISDKICRPCRKGLRDSYEFKLLIERSNAALSDNTKLKKIHFNNINDIKLEIDIDCKPTITKCEDFKEYFTEGVFEVGYNDIVIKRPGPSNDGAFGQPVPVLEFLKSIKEEPDEDGCVDNIDMDDYVADDYGGPSDEDDDYVPSKHYIKNKKIKTKYKKQATTKTKGSQKETDKIKPQTNKVEVKKVQIKPVYLKDLKLMYNYRGKKDKTGGKRKYNEKRMCPYCGLMTRTLKSHLLQHTGERSFKCEVCGKGFFTDKHLRNHMETTHSDTKDFKCDHCTACFNFKGKLINHLRRHSTERNHVCDICSKGFKRKDALQRHYLTHSSANKTVMCDQCNMSFYDKFQLRHHMRIHTGERPYKCEICSQPYSYKHDFNRHCFKKHGVFLKRRSVYVMNEEVLKQEKILMRDLMLRVHGILKDDKPLNPFEGPQAALAFEMAVKAIESKQIAIDL